MAVTSEERLKILNLVEQGKISAREGIRLLEALEKSRSPQRAPAMAPSIPQPEFTPGAPRWLRVRITDTASGKTRVNIRLPVTVLSAGMKMGARFSPELNQQQMDEIFNAIHSGEVGQILDVYKDDDSEHVEVLLE